MDVYFRFSQLTKLQALTLEREVMFSSSEQKGKGDEEATNVSIANVSFVGYVLLNHQTIHDINDFFVRQKVALKDCALCLTALTDSKNQSVPSIVNEMLHYIDCQLVVSIT